MGKSPEIKMTTTQITLSSGPNYNHLVKAMREGSLGDGSRGPAEGGYFDNHIRALSAIWHSLPPEDRLYILGDDDAIMVKVSGSQFSLKLRFITQI